MNYGHSGIDFTSFSQMEMKALERHLQFNGELAECQDRNCRVYKLYKLLLLYQEPDEVLDDFTDTESCSASDYDSLVNGSDDEINIIRK